MQIEKKKNCYLSREIGFFFFCTEPKAKKIRNLSLITVGFNGKRKSIYTHVICKTTIKNRNNYDIEKGILPLKTHVYYIYFLFLQS